MKPIQSLVAASVLSVSVFAVPALADDGWYVVGSVGQSKVKDMGKSDNDQYLISNGAAGLVSKVDDTYNTAYKLQLGYRVSPYVSIEGGYVDLGKGTYQATFTGGDAYAESRASGLTLAVVGAFPFGDQFSVYGKLGAINAKVTQNSSINGLGLTGTTEDSTSMKANFGIGARYDFSKRLGVRLEWERFSKLGDNNTTGTSDVDMLSIGLVDKF